MKKTIIFPLLVILLGLFLVSTKPTVNARQACSQLSSTSSATLRGQITDTGGTPEIIVWFRWRIQNSSTWYDTPRQEILVTNVPYDFSHTLNNLRACTVYEYRAVASNIIGASEGNIECFRTACQPLTISCTATPNPATINQIVTFSSNVSGGQPPYSYSWSGACTGSSANCQTSFGYIGNYTAYLTVRDSAGNGQSTQCSVSVQGRAPTVITLPPVVTL